MAAQASPTLTPATRSAAAMESRTASIVFSRLTTTPLRRPSLGTVPSPMMSSTPSLAISPMTVHVLVVPISRTTMMRSSLTTFTHSPGVDRCAAPWLIRPRGPTTLERGHVGGVEAAIRQLDDKAFRRVAYHPRLVGRQQRHELQGLICTGFPPPGQAGQALMFSGRQAGQHRAVERPGGLAVAQHGRPLPYRDRHGVRPVAYDARPLDPRVALKIGKAPAVDPQERITLVDTCEVGNLFRSVALRARHDDLLYAGVEPAAGQAQDGERDRKSG